MKTHYRLFALLLTLILACGVLPVGAFAEDNYGILISGRMLTSENYTDPTIMRDGAVTYDPLTNTLTLSGLDINLGDDPLVEYLKSDTLNVVAKGSNTVSGWFFKAEKGGGVAFSAESTGSLAIGKANDNHDGITASRVTVNGGTLKINSTRYGIEAGLVEINGGSVYIYTDPAEHENRKAGISAMDMSVFGGEVEILGYEQGINVKRSLNIDGGSVGVSGVPDIGVKGGQVALTGGTLIAKGGKYGVSANSLSVSGGAKLFAKKTDPSSDGCAAYAATDFDVDSYANFVPIPSGGFVGDLPSGGKTVFSQSAAQASAPQPAMEAAIIPVLSCYVSRNGGDYEPADWSFDATSPNVFQCPVGETVSVLLRDNTGEGTFDDTVNGMAPHAEQYVSNTALGKDTVSYTFTPKDRLESDGGQFGPGTSLGARDQFSYYRNIILQRPGIYGRVGVMVFETMKGDLTFELPSYKPLEPDVNRIEKLVIRDSAGSEVIPGSKDFPGVPATSSGWLAESSDTEVITSVMILIKESSGFSLYSQAGSQPGSAEVTVSFSGNTSYNAAQKTFNMEILCLNCAEGTPDEQFLTPVEAKDSTCKTQGWDGHWKCRYCGKLYGAIGSDGKRPLLAEVPYRPLNPDNHTNLFIQDDDPAWCDRTGTFFGYCNDCNKSIQKTYEINPNHHYAHRFEEVQGRDATCTQPGTAAHYACSACGGKYTKAVSRTETDIITSPEDEITDTVIPAKGHKWVENAEDKYLKSKADCENPAVYYKSCEHCGISTKELYDLRAAAANFTPGSAETVTIDGVEFYILAVDDGKALLLTKDVETFSPSLGIEWDSNKWMDTGIRTYLNGEWLAGKPVLKNLVKETEIKTRTPGAPNSAVLTRDKVFLLSEADVFDTVNGIFYAESSAVDYTYNDAPFIAPGRSWVAYNKDSGSAYMWALRSPGETDHVHYVANNGSCKSFDYKRTGAYGVRPAMWVRFADPDPTPEWREKIESITPGAADTVTIDGVKFHVLAKENGNALLLTKHVLFNESELRFGSTPSWADSDLKKFVNGITTQTAGGERFFSPGETPTLWQYAQETEIYTPAGYDSSELVMTQDKLFLLSEADLFGTQNDHPEAGTKVFTYNGSPLPAPGGSWIATDVNGTPRYWWLRSPRNNQYSVAQILDNGNLNSINSDAYDYYGIRGVRPALWIQYREPVPEPETFEDGKPLGHDWGKASYNWQFDASGNGVCTAQHTCTREGCKKGEFERITATREETIAPTCTKPGQYTYTAIFTKTGFETQYEYRDIAPLGGDHEWQVEKWTWDYPDIGDRIIAYGAYQDYPVVTLKLKCSKCGDGVSVAVLKEELQLLAEGDVCKGGTRSFIAEVDYEGVTYSDKNTFETINAEGHAFGDPTYSWSYASNGNPMGCTASHTCKRCNHPETEDGTVTSSQTKDPTCTAQGQRTYTATFTKAGFVTQYEYSNISALGHNWVDKVEDTYLKSAADCEHAAVYHKSCGRCGDKHTSETFIHGKPLGHNWVEKAEDEYLKSAADCEYAAVYYKSCDRCGDKHTSETFTHGKPLGHNWVEKAEDKYLKSAADCDHAAVYHKSCDRCGDNHASETFTHGKPLGHNWVEKAEDKYLKSAATCTNAAVYHKSCGRCGDKHTSETFIHGKPLGHNWVEKVEDKYLKSAADCEHAAVYHKSCARCGDKHASETFESGNALGHDYGKWYVVTPATDRRKGLDRRDCKRVGCTHFETSETNMVEYKTELEESGNGKTTVEPADPQSGDGVKITVEPGDDSRVKDITVTDGDGNKIEVTDKGDGEYEFTMPEGDVKIVVEYEPKPAVTVDENEGGKTKVEPEHPDAGDEVKITVTPEEDKRVKEITVTDKDGNKIDVTDKGNGEYEFTMPDSDVTIEVEYEPKPTVTVDENEGGKTVVDPAHPDTGDEVVITPKPDEGFEVDKIKVTDKNGGEIDVKKNDDGTYTFVMPEDDVKIEITYKEETVSPPTDDASDVILWIALMCLSVAGCVTLFIIKKRAAGRNCL